MNFEELIESRAHKTIKIQMPYGLFYKRLINGRYSHFVEFRDELTDSLAFTKGLQAEFECVGKITNRHQLHFTPSRDDAEDEGGESGSSEVFAIAVEPGNLITIGQLLNEDPAIVARKDFIGDTIRDLMNLTQQLNEREVYHLCFAPNNVLVRKTDHTVYLLNHGSFYLKVDQDTLWEDVEGFVAPEVMQSQQADARSDVYSLGKFICWLYESSGMPFGLQKVIDRAVSPDPEKRYKSVAEFHKALSRFFTVRRQGGAAAAAIAIALAVLGLFFYLLPQPEVIEYVKPVDEPIPDEMVDDDLLLGIGADADSATIARIVAAERHRQDSVGVDERKLRMYNAKAEAIFRKQFTKAADEILSKVYNNGQMNMSEKDFMVRSKAMTEELARKQAEIAKKSHLPAGETQRIASSIIEQLTDKKMKALDKDYMGIRKQKDEMENDMKQAKQEKDKEKK